METLLAIVTLGQRTYGRWLFQRLLSGMLAIAGLTIVIAIMISAALIATLAALYYTLLSYQIGHLVAGLVTGISAIAIIMMLIILTLACLNHLRQIPKTLLQKSPLSSGIMDTLDAFTEGLKQGTQ